MTTLRCERDGCGKVLLYQREDRAVEYENRDGTKLIILGAVIVRCRCGHYNRIDPLSKVFSSEIKSVSFTQTDRNLLTIPK